MTPSTTAAAALVLARRSSGASVRQLARRADVAASTITRVEAATSAPTVPVLERLVQAAGFELAVEVRRRGTQVPRLADLAPHWDAGAHGPRPRWTRWRALLDHLAQHPDAVPDAIYVPPPPSGDAVIDALLAAVAEKLADDAGLPRPAWCHDVPSLTEPFEIPLPSHAARDVPPQLAARNLRIGGSSLWRDHRRLPA